MVSDWEGGGGYVTPGGSQGEFAGRPGQRFEGSIWNSVPANTPVRPGTLVDDMGEIPQGSRPTTREYATPSVTPSWTSENRVQPRLVPQPLRRDLGVEGLPSYSDQAMGVLNQEDADRLAASFLHVPVEQIPEDYEFLEAQRGMGARNPRELRSRLRRMSEDELRESLFGKRTAVDLNTPFGASGTGWGRTSRQTGAGFDDRAVMDPAWSIAVQHYEDRLRGGGASREGERIMPPSLRDPMRDPRQLFAARGPLPEDDGIVSLDALQRVRQ